MTTVFLPLWNSFRSGLFEETKQKYNHFNNGRAARNGICFSSCLKLLQKHALKIQKITSTKKKEIAHEHVIEKYSFNLQFESFMVSKCVNTATFSLAMTFCHQKKFINRQHLAQITFLPRPALIHSLPSACFPLRWYAMHIYKVEKKSIAISKDQALSWHWTERRRPWPLWSSPRFNFEYEIRVWGENIDFYLFNF